MQRQETCFTGRFASLHVDAYEALKHHAADILHPEEMRYFVPLPAERRRISYLLGRYAAKRALGPFLDNPAFNDININPGVFMQPVIRYPMLEPLQVSISHSDAMVCAIAFPMAHPMALDVETIDAEKVAAMATQYRDSELAALNQLELDVPTASSLLWTAKEALSKTLHTGMMCPFDLFEVHSISRITEFEFQGLYKNLAQYKFHSWIYSKCVLTMTLPKRTEIRFESGPPHLPSEDRPLNQSP